MCGCEATAVVSDKLICCLKCWQLIPVETYLHISLGPLQRVAHFPLWQCFFPQLTYSWSLLCSVVVIVASLHAYDYFYCVIHFHHCSYLQFILWLILRLFFSCLCSCFLPSNIVPVCPAFAWIPFFISSPFYPGGKITLARLCQWIRVFYSLTHMHKERVCDYFCHWNASSIVLGFSTGKTKAIIS